MAGAPGTTYWYWMRAERDNADPGPWTTPRSFQSMNILRGAAGPDLTLTQSTTNRLQATLSWTADLRCFELSA